MTTTNNKEETYWQSYISMVFNDNLNLYAEFPMHSDNTCYSDPIIFKDGYKLPMINKNVLLRYIVKYINERLFGSKYIVSTVGRRPSKSLYYIVVSIIQNRE